MLLFDVGAASVPLPDIFEGLKDVEAVDVEIEDVDEEVVDDKVMDDEVVDDEDLKGPAEAVSVMEVMPTSAELMVMKGNGSREKVLFVVQHSGVLAQHQLLAPHLISSGLISLD